MLCTGAEKAVDALKPEQVASQVEEAGKLTEGKYTSLLRTQNMSLITEHLNISATRLMTNTGD